MKAVLVVVIALAALPGCSTDAPTPADTRVMAASTSTPTPRGWDTTADPEWLFEIRHPRSWRRGPLLVSHGDRRQWEMLALATYELEPGGEKCDHVPVRALEDLGPTDGFLYVQEPEYVAGLPPRRDVEVHFETRPLNDDWDVFWCVEAPRDLRYAFVPFRDGGRSFFAHLALGSDAPERRRRELLRIFDSLRILNAEQYRARRGA